MWRYDFEQEASNRGSPEAARLGALQALAALSDVHGRSLASSALESLTLAVKFTARCSCPLTPQWFESDTDMHKPYNLSCPGASGACCEVHSQVSSTKRATALLQQLLLDIFSDMAGLVRLKCLCFSVGKAIRTSMRCCSLCILDV